MEKYTVDILIPTYKPGAETAELLRRLADQVYPVHQLLIVNTEEKYWNPELEKAYPGCQVRHIRREEFDHGGTRDWMARQSAADILLFMTQDALPADNRLVSRLAAMFADPQVKAAYARQLPERTAACWKAIPEGLIIRRRALSRAEKICRSWGSKPSSAQTSAQPMSGRPTWSWAGFRSARYLMRI